MRICRRVEALVRGGSQCREKYILLAPHLEGLIWQAVGGVGRMVVGWRPAGVVKDPFWDLLMNMVRKFN